MLRFIALGLASLASAISVTPVRAETIFFENARGQDVLLCVYRHDSKELLRSRDCWPLDKGQKARWDRGEEKWTFDIRIFEQGLFELPICFRQDFRDVDRITILPRKSGECVRAFTRVAVEPKLRETGDAVLVNLPKDNYWYPAQIIGHGEASYDVRLANGFRRAVGLQYIVDYDLGAGSRVEVNWKNFGRWYPVEIVSGDADGFRVRYSDGSLETARLDQLRVEK